MSLLVLALVGGLLALDSTSVGQFMVSRPLVAGALAGWILGDPAQGLLVGAMLELYLLVSFPTGGSRFPEGPTATVVAVASVAAAQGPGAFPVGVAVGLLWGQVGGFTITGLRKFTATVVPEPGGGGVSPARVQRVHLGAVFLDLLRGTLVTLLGVMAGPRVVQALTPTWPLAEGGTMGLLLVGAAVSCGILLRNLGGFRRRRVLFTAGMALGILGIRFL